MKKNWPEMTSAFAFGLGIGAVMGLLFAPKAGEDTRAYLRDKAQDTADEAVSRGRKAARHVQRVVDDTRELVNEAVDAGQEALREARNS
jgi:gas vesicle protein